MATKQTYPAPKAFKGAKVHVWAFDSMLEAADKSQSDARWHKSHGSDSWAGQSYEQAWRYAREGDLSAVAASDALLDKMEAYGLATVKAQWVDDVAGATPNVQAYVAGVPLTMRRRTKAASNAAPLAIIVDLATSAFINVEQARKRGVAILALVRALSQRRPVELWACSGLDADGCKNACFLTVRIDTAPLDLARAAYCLTNVGFPRRILYGLASGEFGFNGHWPFGRGRLSRSEMEACLAPAFQHVTQTLCIPGAHMSNEALDNPEAWLAKEIAEHDPIALREAAE